MHTDSIRVSPDRPARDATATLGRSPQRSRRRGRKPVPTPAPTARRQEAAMVPSTTANVVILGLLAVGIALIGLFMYAILFSFSQPGL